MSAALVTAAEAIFAGVFLLALGTTEKRGDRAVTLTVAVLLLVLGITQVWEGLASPTLGPGVALER